MSLHDVRDFYMRLMMQENSPSHENLTPSIQPHSLPAHLFVRLAGVVRRDKLHLIVQPAST
ncbi:hypothetical protein CBE89_12320 [Corynebacterium striatum]|uniref:Uncharacterized protein n=1 Tax=Corynebacterium striatum TaxID=43770 RepID=A0A2Z2IZG5_CORST|nr:hypothetical protein CBE89_12320 [Corynebacterium striatum]TXS61477.1 hypothetical protein CHU71_11835 [Corynebacterium sp. LK14]GKH15985.1 hypothetical protein CE91St29_02980 [Corynebacterium striatum]